VRIWRCDVTLNNDGLVLRNPVRTYRLGWSDITAIADSHNQTGEAVGGWALQITVQDGRELTSRPLQPVPETIVRLRELAAAHGIEADITGESPKSSPGRSGAANSDIGPRIVDYPEATRSWKRRRVGIWLCLTGVVVWSGLGTYYGCVNDYADSFGATVTSKDCGIGGCVVYLNYTQPNGESHSSDPWYQVDARRIHTRPDGTQVMTLYWFPSSGDVDTSSGFWGDIAFIAVVDLVLVGIASTILAGSWAIRRQARTASSPTASARSSRH
jgi:hypothetical protein